MKQPGQQQEGGGGPTGQHANVIIPRGGRRPSGKQVRRFFYFRRRGKVLNNDCFLFQGPGAQPHSVDSGIESPRSILGAQVVFTSYLFQVPPNFLSFLSSSHRTRPSPLSLGHLPR